MSGDTVIQDGRSGNSAKVGANNRLHTDAISKAAVIESSLNGDTYIFTTGSINLTSDSISWILFAKNTDTVPWVVESITATYGKSTGGSGDSFNQFNTGATSGTLVDDGVDSVGINLNIGSPKPLTAIVKIGGEGKTITDGLNAPITLIPEGALFRTFPAGPVVVPPGTSFAVAFTPPVGNTNQNTAVQVVFFRELPK